MKNHLLTLTALFLLIPSHTLAWSGTAMTGPEKDTLTVQRDNEKIKIRLYGIKSPKAEQSFKNEMKKATASLVKGRQVVVNEVSPGEQGQPVALVYISGQNLNRHLIQEGYALVDTKHCQESFCSTWISIETFSRLQGRGMWADKEEWKAVAGIPFAHRVRTNNYQLKIAVIQYSTISRFFFRNLNTVAIYSDTTFSSLIVFLVKMYKKYCVFCMEENKQNNMLHCKNW